MKVLYSEGGKCVWIMRMLLCLGEERCVSNCTGYSAVLVRVDIVDEKGMWVEWARAVQRGTANLYYFFEVESSVFAWRT